MGSSTPPSAPSVTMAVGRVGSLGCPKPRPPLRPCGRARPVSSTRPPFIPVAASGSRARRRWSMLKETSTSRPATVTYLRVPSRVPTPRCTTSARRSSSSARPVAHCIRSTFSSLRTRKRLMSWTAISAREAPSPCRRAWERRRSPTSFWTWARRASSTPST